MNNLSSTSIYFDVYDQIKEVCSLKLFWNMNRNELYWREVI